MNNSINTWLEDPAADYNEGLNLYRSVGQNKFLLRMLSLKENRYNRAKLVHELSKFKNGVEAKEPKRRGRPKKETSAPGSALTTSDLPLKTYDLPLTTEKDVEKLEVALGKMHNKKGLLSNELRNFDVKDNEGRKKVLDQIDDINESMNQVREKLKYFEQHGVLPPEPGEKNIFDDIPTDPAAMQKMKYNETANKSKYNKQLKEELTEVQRAKVEKRLADSVALINEIKRRLGERMNDE